MDHVQFLNQLTLAERKALAAELGCHWNFLEQLRYRCKRPGPIFAQKLAKASGGRVRLHEMRPDIWSRSG
jgi:DNA-binding transcriptional regulator YdaS (Cro superfamily)